MKNVINIGRVVVLVGMATVLGAEVVSAQPKVEVSGLVGWTLSDGVDGDNVVGADGNIYNEIAPKDSGSWGADVAVNVTDRVQVGFLFTQQRSTAEVSGVSAAREIGDLTIDTYHPYVAFNFTPADAPVRPFVLAGVGATHYGAISFQGFGGQTLRTSGETQYSGTLGGGVKIFARNLGVRLGAQWTPTYIKTDSVGWWCDPFWGCYVVGDAQYANQFQFTAGLTLRF